MDKAGIREVAKAAGVSISTVSRAFAHPEVVSEKTRHKVLQAADQLDFNISRSAAALKSGQTFRVALLMNEEITSWFNTQIFAGINSIMHDAGYDISVFQHIDTADMRRKFFTDLPVRRNVDAVFVASFAIDEKEVEQLKRIRVPIIGINTPSIDGFDASISIDDENGMYTATQHLLNLGHKHIVYACSAASESMDSSIDARGRGFIRACENVEKRRELNWQVVTVPRGRAFADSALSALLALDEFPDAICCQIDMMDDSADAQARTLRTPHATRLLDHRLRRQPLCRHRQPHHHETGPVQDGTFGRPEGNQAHQRRGTREAA